MAGIFPIGTDISEGSAPLTIQFIRQGSNGSSYTWTIGDGMISHDQNPVHTFQNPGVFEVTLQTWELIRETLYENEFFSTTITVTEPNPVVVRTTCKGFIASLLTYANTVHTTRFTGWKTSTPVQEAECGNPGGILLQRLVHSVPCRLRAAGRDWW